MAFQLRDRKLSEPITSSCIALKTADTAVHYVGLLVVLWVMSCLSTIAAKWQLMMKSDILGRLVCVVQGSYRLGKTGKGQVI